MGTGHSAEIPQSESCPHGRDLNLTLRRVLDSRAHLKDRYKELAKRESTLDGKILYH
jgi:hypothetical protein